MLRAGRLGIIRPLRHDKCVHFAYIFVCLCVVIQRYMAVSFMSIRKLPAFMRVVLRRGRRVR